MYLIFKWGNLILSIEQNINKKARIRHQLEYSQKLNTGEVSLIFQWKQNV